jgi:hydrogenase expression/formation protein HypE
VVVAPDEKAKKIVEAMQSSPLGAEASIIGRVTDRYPGKVCIKTVVGGERIMDMIVEEPFPRIC